MNNPNTTRYVGLDVHKDTIAIAVADPGRGDPEVKPTIPNDFTTLMKALRRLGDLDKLLIAAQRRSSFLDLQSGLGKEGSDQVRLLPKAADSEVVA